jgi:uncharacterized protein (DUF2252 family)
MAFLRLKLASVIGISCCTCTNVTIRSVYHHHPSRMPRTASTNDLFSKSLLISLCVLNNESSYGTRPYKSHPMVGFALPTTFSTTVSAHPLPNA